MKILLPGSSWENLENFLYEKIQIIAIKALTQLSPVVVTETHYSLKLITLRILLGSGDHSCNARKK